MLSMEKLDKEELQKLRNRLQKQYDSTYNLDDLKSFFIGVADYVKIIIDSDYLSGILSITILSERDNLRKEIDKISKKSTEETLTTLAQIRKIIKEKKIDNSVVKDAIKECEDFIKGDIKKSGSGNFATYLIDDVRDILIALKYNGYEKIADQYAVFDERAKDAKGNKIVIDWKISASEKEVDKMLNKLKEQQDISIWGAWEELYWGYATIFIKHETWDKLVKNDNVMNRLDFSIMAAEMKEILEGKAQDPYKYHFFTTQKFKRHLQRVQNKLDSVVEDLILYKPKHQKKSREEEIVVGKLFSVSNKAYPAVFYKGKNKQMYGWHPTLGLTQSYATIRLAAERYMKLKITNQNIKEIRLSYFDIANYLKNPNNCHKPLSNWGKSNQKEQLDDIRSNLSKKFGFTLKELFASKVKDNSFLIFILK